ncbi:hypothetical protein D9757_000138 [Collybiopsis confluens]|uniref:Uncharacterized protein n=1 Tax=Collybiopsis confluens TaxID=2823264 RepID=A0A8H5I272_9AGAR|nr:hypothetical protein D9757_000138 [Collybiopsis confluens]
MSNQSPTSASSDMSPSSRPTSPRAERRSGSRSNSLSPAARRRHNTNSGVPHGFLASPKPKQTPLSQMSLWELQNLYHKNERILASPPTTASSTYIQRINTEQQAIQELLIEVHGMEVINTGMKNARISEVVQDDGQDVEMKPESSMSKAIDAKKRALEKFGATAGPSHIGMLGMQEAIEIEQRAHAYDLQKKQRIEQKRMQHGYPMNGEIMSREERERRIWDFMNCKPTESDLEDEDEDEDGDDPAGWFDDEEDDGRKGQNIVEPDEEDPDLHNIIRVIDPNQTHYHTFYEPKDED